MRTDQYQGPITPLMYLAGFLSLPFNLLFFSPLGFVWVGVALYRAPSPTRIAAIAFLCFCSAFFNKIELQVDQQYPVGHPQTVFIRYPKHLIDSIMAYFAITG